MIIVDASVVVWLLAERESMTADAPLVDHDVWVAPAHVDIEVLSALRRYVVLKRLSLQRAEVALADFSRLRIDRYELSPMLHRIWELRDNITAYDAAYVALAETLRSELFTRDARLAAAPGHRARIVLVH